MKQYVTGLHKVINNFRVVGRVTEARIVEAVEVTSVEVTNHARGATKKARTLPAAMKTKPPCLLRVLNLRMRKSKKALLWVR